MQIPNAHESYVQKETYHEMRISKIRSFKKAKCSAKYTLKKGPTPSGIEKKIMSKNFWQFFKNVSF